LLTTNGTTASWAGAAPVAQTTEPTTLIDGLIWVDTDGAVVGQAVVRWSKAPTGGTTSLSGLDDSSVTLSYTAGYEQVYRNGTLLSRGNDYTATNGTSITLINATLTGDIIEVIGSSVLAIADVYTQAQSNSNYIGKALTTTTGDMIYASAANTPARLGVGTNGQVLTVASGIPSWATPAGATRAYAIFQDAKAVNTAGGTFTSGAWRTRDLQTTQVNTITSCSLASNQITLPAGTYYVWATTPSRAVQRNYSRLYNTTDSATLIPGSISYSGDSSIQVEEPINVITGVFTIAGTKVIELQHRCSATKNGDGFGSSDGSALDNVQLNIYSQITIEKIG
jgi:hypothetical protein